MPIELTPACAQVIGTRQTQQDSAEIFQLDDANWLFILADGMGGHVGGREASKITVRAFHQAFIRSTATSIKAKFYDALQHANNSVYDYVVDHPDMDGMGTTLIAVLTDGEKFQWISVGDSPLWLLENNQLLRINANHSVAEELKEQVAKGEITEEEARFHPNRSQLLEAVMGDDITLVDAPDTYRFLESDSILILASDGVETCTEEEIFKIVKSNNSDSEIADSVLNAVMSKQREGQDNASIIIAKTSRNSVEVQEQPEVVPADMATVPGKE